jgi:hypothetical protein
MSVHPLSGSLQSAEYHKSSYSSGSQECVQVAFAAGLTGIQDTKGPRRTLVVPQAAFATFVAAISAGQTGR